jgi:hypothetical protein
MMTGSAFAHSEHHKKARLTPAAAAEAPVCSIAAEPGSFMDEGEFKEASSVADIVEVECSAVYAEHYVTLSSQELYSRCAHRIRWESVEALEGAGPSLSKVQLDDDGNATVAVWGGPSCAAGESLITAELEEAPYTTVTTGFTVLPPQPSTPELKTLPETQVENATISSVVTIVQVEFPPVYAEHYVRVSANELWRRCGEGVHLGWWGPDWTFISSAPSVQVKLDNDGNAFLVLYGYYSCAAGPSLIEASLEHAPYTTETTTFTVEPPRPTFLEQI